MAGVITGQTYKESDPNTQRLLDDWRQLYVLRDVDLDGYNRMPPAVEVVVGELRPSACDAFNKAEETNLVCLFVKENIAGTATKRCREMYYR